MSDRRTFPEAARILLAPARIVASRNGRALIEADRETACGACSAKAGCGTLALSRAMPIGPRRSVLDLPVSSCCSQAGDRAFVAISGEDFVKLSLLAHLVPPAALAATALVSSLAGWSDMTTAALCIPVFALSLIPLRIAERAKPGPARLWLETDPAGRHETSTPHEETT